MTELERLQNLEPSDELSAEEIAELIANEEAAILNRARLADLKERWAAIRDADSGFPAFRELYSVPNAEVWFRDEVLSNESAADAEVLLAEVENQQVIWLADKAANEYKELRRNDYGNVQDQLDEIYHDIDAWKSRISAIKIKYPKS